MKNKLTIFAVMIIALLNFSLSGCKLNNNDLEYTKKLIESAENFSSPEDFSGKTELPANTPTNKVILDAPIIKQNPELKDGCEVTSLAMMLQYAGVNVDKITLAKEVKKDSDPLKKKNGKIVEWGNPEDGFVGDITGKTPGFGVYNKPIYQLTNKYLPNRAVDLTGQSFDALIDSLNRGRPVVVWLTTDLDPPHIYKNWEDGDDGKNVKVTFQEHAVLLTGYDEKYCYINNPLSSIKNEKLTIEEFKKIWTDMGSMAVTYN